MAKAPTKINPNDIYKVVLNRSIPVGRQSVHPGPNVKLRGDVLQTVIDRDAKAVESYELAPEVSPN